MSDVTPFNLQIIQLHETLNIFMNYKSIIFFITLVSYIDMIDR